LLAISGEQGSAKAVLSKMLKANDQFVHKDDVLFTIDQDRYRLALADAEAALAVKHAQYLMLLDQYERRSKLSPGYKSPSRISTTRADSRNQQPPATSRRVLRATPLR
jgi:multidrug resistance efflux pump